MNLGLHGLLLQVIVSIVQFQNGFRLCSAGEPGYLDFDNLPETNFSCQGKVIGGYYADVEAGCQMFHVCTIGQKDEIMDIKFLCLNGTVFDQETRVCERVDEVDCSKSERFYNLNLELYGNHAVTLSLHESSDDDDESDLIDDHDSQRTTSVRPSTTSSTTTTTSRPSISSTTSASGSYQHPNGYPQHYQPQPRFPSVQTSQSKSLYDDKNGGYHHQYIYHTGDHRTNNLDNNNSDGNGNNNENHNNNNNNQATSYQLFSNQGVSSTTGAPQIHQIRYSSTPATQIQIHNDHQPTVSPIFHATSSTIQTLLNSNANSPALINPIFHNHGIASTTEQFTVHNNNPRETDEYHDDDQSDHEDSHREENHEDRRPLEAIQPTTQGKVSKLTISPIANHDDNDRTIHQGKNNQQQRLPTSFLPTPSSDDSQSVRSFYPTPRTSTKSSSSHVTHIHLPPPPSIPQLKPHQITINLPSPDIQRIVQNPSPLLPSQSRVIVTAKASVSDESGRALNTTQLVTIPLPTIPASYDDYKEGDESFDPFYRDVPKIRNDRRAGGRFRWPVRDSREKRSTRIKREAEIIDKIDDVKIIEKIEASGENLTNETKNQTMIDEIIDEKSIIDNDKNDDHEIEKDESRDKKEKEKNEETKVEDDEEAAENLKTMSTKHHSDSEENIEKKLVIDTKDSDEEEYVESVDEKLKSVVESKRIAEEDNSSESEEAKSIDSKIFDEPESQTSKEVDTRAVAQHDSKYSKNRENHFGDEKKSNNDRQSNDLETQKRESENESSRFSLLTEIVNSGKSQRKHSKSNVRERISEDEEEDEDDEEFVDRRKSHRKNSSKKSKLRKPISVEDEEIEDTEEEEDFVPRKSHRKYSTKKSMSRGRAPIEDDDGYEGDDEEEEEEEEDEVVNRRKSHRKNSSRKSKLRERFPDEAEEDEEDYEEIYPRKYHRKHSSKKSKLRRPAEEEEDDYEIVDRRKSRGRLSRKSKSRKRLPSEEEDEDYVYGEISSENFKDEKSQNYDYYDSEIDSSSVRSREEDSTDFSKESLNKLKSSRNHKSSQRDKNRNFNEENDEEDDYDFYDSSTTQSNEEVTSVEMDGDYVEGSKIDTNTEDSREFENDEEMQRDGKNIETLIEIDNSTEKINSADESMNPRDEGVLKFTDEIPSSEKIEEPSKVESSKSAEETAQDYIDDNYEPQSYKEQRDSPPSTEAGITLKSVENETTTLKNEEEKRDEISTTEIPGVTEIGTIGMEEKQNDEAYSDKDLLNVDEKVEKSIDMPIAEETTSTTSTTTTTTTTTPKPTTPRPTPPKLFKPATLRKSYVYFPPTTTPIPVIIKPRLPLLNPKPAKPPKSYNELAPKPIIRKSPLYARKTTVRTTTPHLEIYNHEISTELTLTTTQDLMLEEITSSTILPSLMITEISSASSEPTTLSPFNEDKNLPSTTLPPLKEDKNSSHEDHLPMSTMDNFELLPTTEAQTFTPYPLLAKLSQTTIQKLEEFPEQPKEETTEKTDLDNNNVPSISEREISTTTLLELTTLVPEEISTENPTSTKVPEILETPKIEKSNDTSDLQNVATILPELEIPFSSTIQADKESATINPEISTTLKDAIINKTPTLASIRAVNRKPGAIKRTNFFNCLEKEMYRFYADGRDCRLFHYCSPGFTSRQVLDFRFVCEQGTAFDEETQSCIHEVKSSKCQQRVW